MGYYLNKIAFGLVNPLTASLLLAVAALVLFFVSRRMTVRRVWPGRLAAVCGCLAVVWLWFCASNVCGRLIGPGLEDPAWLARAEDTPAADAIVVLGGGMLVTTNAYHYADMSAGADRVWHAARLYHAGKAPLVIATGTGEMVSTRPLLIDFGVPDEAIVIEDAARNTEENARLTAELLAARGLDAPRVLLVTSAWHMKRSLFTFSRYASGLEIIPAATDCTATIISAEPWTFKDFWPDADALQRNTMFFKERLGDFAYRYLFR